VSKTYLEALKDAVGAAVCLAAVDLDRTSNFIFGTPRGAISGAACNDPTPPPPIPPPFNGGQCDGIPYEVFYTYVANSTPGCTNGDQNFGPFSRIVNGPVGGLSFGSGQDGACDEASFDSITLTHGETQGSTSTQLASRGLNEIKSGQITNIVRVDGLPDDCGDPPPPPPPPPSPQPINFTYVNNEGDNVNVSGDVNIGIPILIAPFTLVAPVSVDAGGINFDGSVTLAPDFDVTLSPSFGDDGGGGGGGGGADEPTEPTEPDDEDPDDEDPDEPTECEETPLKGLLVGLNFSSDMRPTEVRQDGSLSSLAVPRAAILYFIAKAGNRSVYMPGIDLKSRSQYVPVPYNTIVTCWRIHTEPGVSVRSTRPVFDIPT
jgi:hypothetical protein